MFTLSLSDTATPWLIAKAREFPAIVEHSLDVTMRAISNEAMRQEGRIRTNPIPRSETGRPLWEWTGELAASRHIDIAPGERTMLWDAVYALRRFTMWYDWTPANPAGGVQRKNHVPRDTYNIVKVWAPRMVQQEIENGLNS